ncbi:hypothetical protein BBW68_03570 [Candidatus Erwinia dacicola]|uniref:Uncharacterized protein n=1 Tax=Candidatus Erwinia dacicola TaxID=252393 RepID=A0A1E7Z544_9GAMM|nr:hypothetical protein BBW68_03570 [Candidatus Erwinia dacicola]
MARFLFEVGFRWAMLNANAVGNRASFEVLGTVAVAFSPVRKLLIQLSASLSLLLDIAIKRILADKDIEFQLQAATDVFRRGMGGKLLPDEVLNVWLQPVKSIFWQGFMTPFPCQRIRSPAGVNAVKSGVGINGRMPALRATVQVDIDGSLCERCNLL